MLNAWTEIKRILSEKNYPTTGRAWLNPSATVGDIFALQNFIGHKLPRSVSSLMQIHDGEIYGPQLLYGHKWLCISEIRSLWKESRYFYVGEERRPIWEGSAILIRPFVAREWLAIGHDTIGNYIGL
ncbi:SMI1/KNR4 family protein [Roseateles sp. P5_E1]